MRLQGGEARDWIVCGWFTEDAVYRPLAEKLAASLDAVGAPYDLVSVPRQPGGWEAHTMIKPSQVLAAMDRHPPRTVAFMDVDYTATSDLSWLPNIPADIGLKMGSRRRKSGSMRLTVGSQIMVVKPTYQARDFIETWAGLTRQSRVYGDTDEATLALTMGEPGLWTVCGLDKGRLNSCLIHHWANRQGSRWSGFMREAINTVLTVVR